jgi:ribosomal protein S18 acetylase RimI-like enzyme
VQVLPVPEEEDKAGIVQMNKNMGELRFIAGVPEEDLYWDLFQTTGWNEKYRFSREELGRSLENSWHTVSVYSRRRIIGFGKVISDGVFHALIADLIVDTEFRGRGIGREIMERLVTRCREENIRDIQLFAARGKYSFYERLGSRKRDKDSPGMEYR